MRIRESILATILLAAAGLPKTYAEAPPLSVGSSIRWNYEPGRAGALEAFSGIGVALQGFKADAEMGLALPGAFPDSLLFSFGKQFGDVDSKGIDLAFFGGWRRLSPGSAEIRAALVTTFRFPSPGRSPWPSLYIDIGYARLVTFIDSLPDALFDGDPMIGLRFMWRPSTLLIIDFSISSWSQDEASLLLRAMFTLDCIFRFSPFDLKPFVRLKYSDFFTATGSLDGYSVGIALRLPLSVTGGGAR